MDNKKINKKKIKKDPKKDISAQFYAPTEPEIIQKSCF